MSRVILDLEIYKNLALFGWLDLDKKSYKALSHRDLPWIDRQVSGSCPYFVTFNGTWYDLRVLMCALDCYHVLEGPDLLLRLKAMSDWIILGPKAVSEDDANDFEEYRWWGHPHLDLKEVLGGRSCCSLKKLACRLRMKAVEALPIDPDALLTDAQAEQIVKYNKLDLVNTAKLYNHCRPQLAMRDALGQVYGQDLRSRSDAQIAEKVLSSTLGRRKPDKFDHSYPRPVEGFLHNFRYDTMQLRNFFTNLWGKTSVRFEPTYNPATKKPTFRKLFEVGEDRHDRILINEVVPAVDFRFGGLHSVHKGKAVRGQGGVDLDVASYYPSLILRFGIYPQRLGPKFLEVYQDILDRRLKAKKDGNKVVADGMKIILNSTFGKFAEPYSALFDPLSAVSVCLHGQCAILRLMDLCWYAGCQVIMVNTDGILVDKDPGDAVKRWEEEMKMTLEAKPVARYVVKDSNNHVILYADGTQKVKGVTFAHESTAAKQTNFPVAHRAVVANLLQGTAVEDTIRGCRNVHEFLGVYQKGPSISEVKLATSPSDGGEPVPDLVRYYLGRGDHHLYRKNAKSWTRVADSGGFVLANAAPENVPDDLNYDSYVAMANKLLEKL
jgi:hypothetical protein